jgi:hypothetical protein
MLPPIEWISVSAFDVHLWPRPLTNRLALSAPMRVLCDPDAYRAARIAGNKLELPGFWVFPLQRELAQPGNHFWQRYAIAAELSIPGFENDAPPDVRDWLLPLRCRPRQWPVEFTTAGTATIVTAHVTVWLWPFGWASSIEFSFRPQPGLSVDDVRAVIASLQSSSGLPSFRLSGQSQKLSALFRLLRDRVAANLAANAMPSGAVAKVLRRVVTAVVAPKGSVLPSYRVLGPSRSRLSDSERGRVLGMLMGRDVDASGAIGLEKGNNVHFTPLPGGSFAISKSDSGSLLFMRHPTDTGSRRDKYRCFFANVRSCWIASAALGELVKFYNANDQDLAKLVGAAKTVLGRLPQNYSTDLSQVICGYQA